MISAADFKLAEVILFSWKRAIPIQR